MTNVQLGKEKMKGVAVVSCTPFMGKDLHLDLDAVRENTRYLIDNGITNGTGFIIPGGSSGECEALTMDERKQLFEAVIEEANGQVPIVPGCNHSHADLVIELSNFAGEKGADGVMFLPHYYWPIKDNQIFKFYKHINDNIDLPILVYNNVNVTQVDMDLELLARLAELDKIVALKECTPFLNKFDRVVQRLGDRINIIAGSESWAPYNMLMGAHGFISGISNFYPQLSIELLKSCQEGDWEKAKKNHLQQLAWYNLQWRVRSTSYGKEMSLWKEAMNLIGLKGGKVRLPLEPLSKEEREEVKKVLKGWKIDVRQCD